MMCAGGQRVLAEGKAKLWISRPHTLLESWGVATSVPWMVGRSSWSLVELKGKEVGLILDSSTLLLSQPGLGQRGIAAAQAGSPPKRLNSRIVQPQEPWGISKTAA